MSNNQVEASKNNHQPILFNSILWIGAFTVMLFSFSQSSWPKRIDYIYTSSFLATIIIPVLLNLYVIIPFLLKKERYILFTVVFAINLFVFTQINVWFFNNFIDYLFPDYYFISYHSNIKLIIIFSIFLIGTTLFKLAEDWFYFNRKENLSLQTKNQQIQIQLSSLRSQINPHFLFNSLNVIYALALEKKETTKDAVLQLSDVLRYVIYDSNTSHVTLRDEISILKNYIEFQKYRHSKAHKIKFTQSVENNEYNIYPMLLLPLIENSFKHGTVGELGDTFMTIDLKQSGSDFYFIIENDYIEESLQAADLYSGVGLTNIRKNLDIVYPNSHEFEISKSLHRFKVSLKLSNNAH